MGIPIIHTSFIFLILLLLNIFKSWEDQINRMNLWCTRLYWYTWISPFFLYMRIGYVYLCSYNVRYGNQHWLDPSCTTCKVYCQGCDAYLGFHFVRLIIIQSLFLDFFFFSDSSLLVKWRKSMTLNTCIYTINVHFTALYGDSTYRHAKGVLLAHTGVSYSSSSINDLIMWYWGLALYIGLTMKLRFWLQDSVISLLPLYVFPWDNCRAQ